METQYAKADEQFIAELKEKVTNTTIKNFGPTAINVEYNVQGEIKGRYSARHIETANVHLKPDASFEYEFLAIETTDDADTILVTAKGSGRLQSSTKSMFEGESKFQTASKKLAWLNNLKGRHEGTLNPATGEVSIKLYGKI